MVYELCIIHSDGQESPTVNDNSPAAVLKVKEWQPPQFQHSKYNNNKFHQSTLDTKTLAIIMQPPMGIYIIKLYRLHRRRRSRR